VGSIPGVILGSNLATYLRLSVMNWALASVLFFAGSLLIIRMVG
jgi:uncharacterized membrane protein YfcA